MEQFLLKFYIDTAQFDEIEESAKWGWVAGVTTNPKILASSSLPPFETYKKILTLIDGPVFYQICSKTIPEMKKEAGLAKELIGNRLILKLPASSIGFEAAVTLIKQHRICITAVYSIAQAMIADSIGVDAVAVYYNRAVNLMESGDKMLQGVAECLKGSNTQAIAASLKTVEQVEKARLLGYSTMTLPYNVLKLITTQPITEKTLIEFDNEGVGLI